jgi:Xaa-Pro aminopeptidase
MRESGRIAGISFQKAMKLTKPGMRENQIEAIIEYESKMMGASGLAYVPVVASGKNALIL